MNDIDRERLIAASLAAGAGSEPVRLDVPGEDQRDAAQASLIEKLKPKDSPDA